MPKCKHCLTKFEVKFFNQKFCILNDDCRSAATQYAIEQKEKNFKVYRAKDTKERKEALLSKKQWLDIAQKVVNTFIRLRDKGKPCCACGNKIKGVVHASHYLSQGNHSIVRFHEDNIWSGCYKCNVQLSGNLIEYRKRLLLNIGKDRLEWLEDNGRREKKWEIDEIKEIIKVYKEKIKGFTSGATKN